MQITAAPGAPEVRGPPDSLGVKLALVFDQK